MFKPFLFVTFVLTGMVMSANAQNVLEALEITEADERAIMHDAHLTRIGERYQIQGCADPVRVKMDVIDLNNDGKPEVLLRVFDSACFSGLMQSNVSIYVKTSKGQWRDVLGFLPAFGVRIQPEKAKGYADLVLTVLGGCDPVYRWSGYRYTYVAKRPSYGQQCDY